MFNVEYSFRLHKYQIVPGGPLTLEKAERCRADKIKSPKHHTEDHHRQKISELHAFLTETFRLLETIIQLGPDGFYDDWERLATTAAVRVLRFGRTVVINESSTPLEALRAVGRLMAWTQDVIDRERPMKVSEIAERLHCGTKKIYALIKSEVMPSFKVGGSLRVDPMVVEAFIRR